MNRRSVLRWLGIAPVAAPAAVAAASAALPASPGTRLSFQVVPFVIEMRSDGTSRLVSPADAAHAEAWNRATDDREMIAQIDLAVAGRFG